MVIAFIWRANWGTLAICINRTGVFMKSLTHRIIVLFILVFPLTGCIGTVIGQTADAAIEVGKIPFKVGGAVIDVATGDDDDEKDDKK